MTTFKHILIPTDFSTHSTAAVKLGAEMARRYNGALTLLHVYDPLPYALSPDYELRSAEQHRLLIAEFERSLAAAKRRAETAGAPRTETQLVEGNVPSEIVAFAEAGHFDLIVMGTHGRRGVRHMLLGSVAERVLRSAPCPVLTVKAPSESANEAAKVWPSAP
jgi:universal stress protein A